MKTEDAINILEDGNWREFCNIPIDTPEHTEFFEALDMALAAIRTQQEAEKNEPLTVDELKAMPLKEWVWIEILDPSPFDYWVHIKAESAYYRKHDCYGIDETFFCGYPGISCAFDYEDYGKAWVAYTSRPPAQEVSQ